MDIRQMKVLRAVIVTGSTSAAAKLLNTSQPGISKTIKQLETSIQMTLFERVGRVLRPTAQALAILPDIERTIAGGEVIRQRIDELRSGRRGLIRIAAAAMASSGLLPQAILRFQQQFPDIGYSVTTSTTREVSRLVYENKVDIGVCQRTSHYSSLVSRPIKSAFIVCAMPEDHPLSRLHVVTPEDVADFPLIVSNFNEPHLGARIAETFAHRSLYPRRMLECNISTTSFGLVRAGLGIALVDSFTMPVQGVITRPYAPDIEIQIHAVFSSEQPPSPIVRAFCDTIVSVASEHSNPWREIDRDQLKVDTALFEQKY